MKYKSSVPLVVIFVTCFGGVSSSHEISICSVKLTRQLGVFGYSLPECGSESIEISKFPSPQHIRNLRWNFCPGLPGCFIEPDTSDWRA